VIDLHCHVLPGIDDGPESIDGSLALTRAAAAAGIQQLVATPHVNWRFRNTADAITQRVGELNAHLTSAGVPVEVRTGAEIAASLVGEIDSGELARLGFAGGRWLLIEPPVAPVVTGLDTMVLSLHGHGHRVVLAHPERCPAFHREPRMLGDLVQAGVLTSITAGSLVGQFGGGVRRFALELLRDGMVHNVTSDAHDDVKRPPSLRAELEQAGFGALTAWLTQEVPAAILADEEIPRQPSRGSGGPGRSRLRWLRPRRKLSQPFASR
jgi:protein-tyrosine phosphatase